MYKQKIEHDLKNALKDLGFVAPDRVLSISENARFGDYTSNVALQLTKQKHKNTYQSTPEIANAILEKLDHPDYLERIEIAGPGFINFYLKDKALLSVIASGSEAISKKQKKDPAKQYIVEYADPNTHKMFHIGHLLPLTIGESIARLIEFQGGIVYRSNYGSDIGPTVSKALWGITKLKAEFEAAKKGTLREKVEFLGKTYVLGTKNYSEKPEFKAEIDLLTKLLYNRAQEIMPIWQETRKWSLAYFDTIYLRFGTEFDRRINESEVDQLGKKIVLENTPKVFKKDQGAIIFEGEKHGLHNSVFVTSAQNPTYEGKEMGLTEIYQEIIPFDKLIILCDRPQEAFLKITTAAYEQIDPSFKGKKTHLSFGSIRLSTGKMSSREGNIIAAEDMLEDVKKRLSELITEKNNDQILEKIAVGAIKFALLKYSLGSDIVYDIEQSVSIHGDSGPYLMYTYARTVSLHNRAKSSEAKPETSQAQNEKIAQPARSGYSVAGGSLQPEERELLRLLDYFEAIAEDSAQKFSPNELCNYLLTLAKQFNFYYETHPIIEAENSDFRLALTGRVGDTIKLGLYLLGIETVERM